jgi:hypothetical protein
MWDNDAWGGGSAVHHREEPAHGPVWGCEAREDDSVFPDVKNAEAMIEFLQQDHDKPFFAVYGLWRPHTPFTAPKRFFDMYNPEDIKVPVPAWRQDDLDDVPARPEADRVWGERYELCGQSTRAVAAVCPCLLCCTTFADWSADVSSSIDEQVRRQWLSCSGGQRLSLRRENHWEKTTL